MPLSNSSKAAIAETISKNYGIVDANSEIEQAVTIADQELESLYPSVYISSIEGSNLQQSKFILLRNLYAVYLLFLNNPNLWTAYQQSQSVESVKNSAGSSVSFKSNTQALSFDSFGFRVRSLMADLGLVTPKAGLAFEFAANRLA